MIARFGLSVPVISAPMAGAAGGGGVAGRGLGLIGDRAGAGEIVARLARETETALRGAADRMRMVPLDTGPGPGKVAGRTGRTICSDEF